MRHSIHAIFFEQAADLEAQERYDEALTLLYQAHRWAPDDAELWLRLGVLSVLMTDRAWLARHGKEASHLADMGAVNAGLYLERACTLAPEQPMLHVWHGWALHGLYQDAERAREALARALALDARQPYAHAALARLELAERQPGFAERARTHLEAALASLPESARLHYDHGACLAGLGEAAPARAAFARALGCRPLPVGERVQDRLLAREFHADAAAVAPLIERLYGDLMRAAGA